MADRGSLGAALNRLVSDFVVDPDGYCKNCDVPTVQEISVVSQDEAKDARGGMVFVWRLQ